MFTCCGVRRIRTHANRRTQRSRAWARRGWLIIFMAMSDGNLIPRAARSWSPTTQSEVNPGGPVRSPRIVIVDDEEFVGEMMELLVKGHFQEVTVLRFQNRDTAWQELQRAEPVLLITDMNNHNIPGRTEYMGMSGWKLLPLLAERAVRYPILVVSGSFLLPGIESEARARAGRDLNITFMSKPFTAEFFQSEVRRILGGGGGCGRRFPKGWL